MNQNLAELSPLSPISMNIYPAKLERMIEILVLLGGCVMGAFMDGLFVTEPNNNNHADTARSPR